MSTVTGQAISPKDSMIFVLMKLIKSSVLIGALFAPCMHGQTPITYKGLKSAYYSLVSPDATTSINGRLWKQSAIRPAWVSNTKSELHSQTPAIQIHAQRQRVPLESVQHRTPTF